MHDTFNTDPILERIFIEEDLLKDKSKEVEKLFGAKLQDLKNKTKQNVVSRDSLVILLMLVENEIEISSHRYMLNANEPYE